jgi:hypothetical protein
VALNILNTTRRKLKSIQTKVLGFFLESNWFVRYFIIQNSTNILFTIWRNVKITLIQKKKKIIIIIIYTFII